MSGRPVWNKNDVLTYDDKLMFLEREMTLLQAHSHPISVPACPFTPHMAVSKLPAHIGVTVFQTPFQKDNDVLCDTSASNLIMSRSVPTEQQRNMHLWSQKCHSEDTQGSHKPE